MASKDVRYGVCDGWNVHRNGGLVGDYLVADQVLSLVSGVDLLVIEDFRLLDKGGWSSDPEGLSPVSIAACIVCLIEERNLGMQVVMQMPSERSVITDERLKGWGLWSVGSGGPHVRDAWRHLLVALRRVRD